MAIDAITLVYPILERGLRLREAREQKRAGSVEDEQAALLGDLNRKELRELDEAIAGSRAREAREESFDLQTQSRSRFLGYRYILACWLDEIMLKFGDANDHWAQTWENQKLETHLFGTNVRAVAFPNQAVLLLRQGQLEEALEITFLCVMLGFRGVWEDPQPEGLPSLESWVQNTRERIAGRLSRQELKLLPLEPPAALMTPLTWRDRLQRMVFVAGGVVLILLLISTVYFALKANAGGD